MEMMIHMQVLYQGCTEWGQGRRTQEQGAKQEDELGQHPENGLQCNYTSTLWNVTRPSELSHVVIRALGFVSVHLPAIG